MKKPTYKRGDAAAYYAWLERQDAATYELALRFRPWEIYKLQKHNTYIRVVYYEPGEEYSLLQVETLDEKRFILPVVPHQIDFWGVLGFEEPPVEQDAA